VVPSLTAFNRGAVPLNEQQRALSSCSVNVVDPWQNDTVPDPHFPATGPVYQDAIKWLPGIAGESRSFDAHGQYVRTLAKTANFAVPLGDGRFYLTDTPVEGVNPPKMAQPKFRADVPCETQEPPDLRTVAGPAPRQIRIDQNAPGAAARRTRARSVALDWMRDQMKLVGWDKKLTLSSRPFSLSDLPALKRTLGAEVVK
jgi:hypothetical protein